MQREDALNAHAAGNLPHRESGAEAVVHPLDADALENLDALFIPFNDPDMHLQVIPGLEYGNVLFDVFHFQTINDVHIFLLSTERFRFRL
jgi:hypothetical protein